jgi:hypothetical protein
MFSDAEVLKHYDFMYGQDAMAIDRLSHGNLLSQAGVSLDTLQIFTQQTTGSKPLSSFLSEHIIPSVPRPSLALIKEAHRFKRPEARGIYSAENARFISQVLLPMANIETELPVAEVGLVNEGEISGCKDAELFFVDTLRQLQDSTYRREDHARPQDRVNIYHTREGQALGLQKTYNEPSTLLLETTTSDELILPEAMIATLR